MASYKKMKRNFITKVSPLFRLLSSFFFKGKKLMNQFLQLAFLAGPVKKIKTDERQENTDEHIDVKIWLSDFL